jgi:hypothetical protein
LDALWYDWEHTFGAVHKQEAEIDALINDFNAKVGLLGSDNKFSAAGYGSARFFVQKTDRFLLRNVESIRFLPKRSVLCRIGA